MSLTVPHGGSDSSVPDANYPPPPPTVGQRPPLGGGGWKGVAAPIACRRACPASGPRPCAAPHHVRRANPRMKAWWYVQNYAHDDCTFTEFMARAAAHESFNEWCARAFDEYAPPPLAPCLAAVTRANLAPQTPMPQAVAGATVGGHCPESRLGILWVTYGQRVETPFHCSGVLQGFVGPECACQSPTKYRLKVTLQAALFFTQQTFSTFTVFPFSMPQWRGSF